MDEREMWQWWVLLPDAKQRLAAHGLTPTSPDGRACFQYGSLLMPNRFPEHAKEIVRKEWAKHLEWVASLPVTCELCGAPATQGTPCLLGLEHDSDE